jgi:hypothetical protein
MEQTTATKAGVIKTIYFYLVCFVALMMVVFSTADVINIALKTWVFTKADDNYYSAPAMVCPAPIVDKTASNTVSTQSQAECEKQQIINQEQDIKNRDAQRQRDVVRDISMIVVGIPLFLYHWRIVRKKDIKKT